MTLEAAVLSFYLLFPFLTDGQIYIDRKLGYRILSDLDRTHEISQLQDFLAGKHFIENFTSVIDTGNCRRLMNEIGMGAEEVSFKSSEGKIHLLEFGVEKFSVEQNSSSSKNVVYSNNRQISQIVYDDYYRISEKTIWQNAEKSSDIKLLQKIVYSYEDDSGTPSVVSYEYLTKNIVEQISYNKAGNPVKVQSYLLQDGKRMLTKLQSYAYDDKQRLVSEEIKSFGNNSSNSKTIYKYTKTALEPDTKFYKDGVLRSSTTYENSDRYYTTTYFDNRYSITVTYQNKKRIKEVVSINGVRQRARTFDE
ncbi:MAG: hypothetical protein K6G00_03030 [Treponema sp.]|nr:hypothetical protein [Treponema sp.]